MLRADGWMTNDVDCVMINKEVWSERKMIGEYCDHVIKLWSRAQLAQIDCSFIYLIDCS